MTTGAVTESQCRAARAAAGLYLLMALSAPIGLLYVPGKLVVPGDATATADRIRASESLLRLGIGSELFHQAVAIFLVLALYRLFKAVNERLAVQVVILGALVSVPIVFLNVLNEVAALAFAGGADFLAAFGQPQLDALAYLSMRLHEQGIQVASVFWGLWLFPLGLLAVRSGFVPRALGILLILAGTGYLASAVTALVLPRYEDAAGPVAAVLHFGELPFILWLLVRGTRLQPSVSPA